MVQWCRQQSKKWQVPDILLSAAPSSFQCLLCWSTIHSFLSRHLQLHHSKISSLLNTILLSKSHLDIAKFPCMLSQSLVASTRGLSLIATGSSSAKQHCSSLPMLSGHLSKRAFSKPSSPADWTLPATKQLTRKQFLKIILISPNLIAEYPDLFSSFSLSLSS